MYIPPSTSESTIANNSIPKKTRPTNIFYYLESREIQNSGKFFCSVYIQKSLLEIALQNDDIANAINACETICKITAPIITNKDKTDKYFAHLISCYSSGKKIDHIEYSRLGHALLKILIDLRQIHTLVELASHQSEWAVYALSQYICQNIKWKCNAMNRSQDEIDQLVSILNSRFADNIENPVYCYLFGLLCLAKNEIINAIDHFKKHPKNHFCMFGMTLMIYYHTDMLFLQKADQSSFLANVTRNIYNDTNSFNSIFREWISFSKEQKYRVLITFCTNSAKAGNWLAINMLVDYMEANQSNKIYALKTILSAHGVLAHRHRMMFRALCRVCTIMPPNEDEKVAQLASTGVAKFIINMLSDDPAYETKLTLLTEKLKSKLLAKNNFILGDEERDHVADDESSDEQESETQTQNISRLNL